MSKAVEKLVVRVLNAVIVCIYVLAAWIGINLIVPLVEVRIAPPILEARMTPTECIHDNLIVHAFINKTRYWNGDWARHEGTIMRPVDFSGDDIPYDDWLPNVQLPSAATIFRDKSSSNRIAGPQEFDLILYGACGKDFRVFTEHTSPMTFLRLKMVFGPFSGTPPAQEKSK